MEKVDNIEEILSIALKCKINAFGELTIYDTSIRRGSYYVIKPTNVYLHTEVKVGAEKLGLDFRKKKVKIDNFYSELQTMIPLELEDCLCIDTNE
ncbi:hypothetical protein [Pseudobacillus wudalianchiensis]|uniref:Uncharacterized protein n=1 Tax=Pseudobacillus wudalianchiensis TaxID=1743143 RepID=A0A1B9AGD4_9BACI|nr:hypothetical protein [Bacillus wudalianchiensis]OCA82906.1 hypothetical protein A8F95_14365 [Bacillus wudalianchiensis]